MEAIVLAGGLGTRLKHVVPGLPKPMAPVCGRPFMEILLTSLAQKGFNRVIVSLGHMAEKITTHFGNSYSGMELVYEIEKTPLGTGGAIRNALDLCLADYVFVFNGDTYLDVEADVIKSCCLKQRFPIIVAHAVADTARYGRLEVSNNIVSGFSEKGLSGPGLINAGCYVLPKNILERFPRGFAFSMETDFLTTEISKQRFIVFVSKGKFIDIGIPEDYERAQTELLGLCI